MRMQTASEDRTTLLDRVVSPLVEASRSHVAATIEYGVSIRSLQQTWLRRDVADPAPKLLA